LIYKRFNAFTVPVSVAPPAASPTETGTLSKNNSFNIVLPHARYKRVELRSGGNGTYPQQEDA